MAPNNSAEPHRRPHRSVQLLRRTLHGSLRKPPLRRRLEPTHTSMSCGERDRGSTAPAAEVDVPPALFEILRRGLRVAQEERFASMQDLLTSSWTTAPPVAPLSQARAPETPGRGVPCHGRSCAAESGRRGRTTDSSPPLRRPAPLTGPMSFNPQPKPSCKRRRQAAPAPDPKASAVVAPPKPPRPATAPKRKVRRPRPRWTRSVTSKSEEPFWMQARRCTRAFGSRARRPLAPDHGRAQSKDAGAGRDLYEDGARLYNLGQYEERVQVVRKAYAISEPSRCCSHRPGAPPRLVPNTAVRAFAPTRPTCARIRNIESGGGRAADRRDRRVHRLARKARLRLSSSDAGVKPSRQSSSGEPPNDTQQRVRKSPPLPY